MEQKNNSGSLYKNTKEKPTQPDYTGSATIAGNQYRVSGWVNKSKAGANYLRILFSEQQSQDLNTTASQVTMPMQPKSSQEPVDSVILDDLPF
jgi:hypothetical protein